MAEYIERAALEHHFMTKRHYLTKDMVMDAAYEINKFPAADVAPVRHGRWEQVIHHVEFEDGFVDRLYECCSKCHEPNGRKTSNYCPNCGAKMDLEGGDGA